jgi:hypothetical protein
MFRPYEAIIRQQIYGEFYPICTLLLYANAHEHTNVIQKWPHYKIKYRKKITKTYEKKILEYYADGIELPVNVLPDDGLIWPKHVAAILIY